MRGQLVGQWPPDRIADDHEELGTLVGREPERGGGVETAVEGQQAGPADGQGGQRHPLGAAVDERAERESAVDATAGGDEATDVVGVVERCQPRPGCAASPQCAEEQILVSPHHPFGVTGGAARVQQVDVVAGPMVARSGIGRGGGHRIVVVLAHRQSGQVGNRLHDAVDHLGVGHHRGDVGVVEHVADLGRGVAEVGVDRDGADLEGGERGLEELGPVEQVDAHVVAGTEAPSPVDVGHPVGPLVQLGIGQPPGAMALAAGHDGLAVADGLDRALEQVGQVEGAIAHGRPR